MDSLNALFESGRIIDLILAVVAVEVLVLILWTKLRGAMTRLDMISLTLPGVMLMLAIRTALTDGPHTMTAAFLAAAFATHLWDVARRRTAR